MTTKRTPKNAAWKPSKWYRDDHAKLKAEVTRTNTRERTTANKSNDGRAIAYALWIMERDGVDLGALTGAAIREHNSQFPVKTHKLRGHTFTTQTGNTLPPEATPEARVLYQTTAEGLRAWKVIWSFHYPEVRVYEMVLPNWSYTAPQVVAWEEPADDLKLAA